MEIAEMMTNVDNLKIKAPPFPKRRAEYCEIDDLLPHEDASMPDFVLSANYARQLAQDRIKRHYRPIEGSEDEQKRQVAAASAYYYRLAANGDISEATAAKWTQATVRFGVELTLVYKERAKK